MPTRFEKRCRQPGCGELTANRSGFCEQHKDSNYSIDAGREWDKRNKANPVWKLYRSAAWKIRFHHSFFAAGNVLCQRLVNGVQCNRPVQILHHLISPRQKPNLFFTFSNVVGVCRQHHPNCEGEPVENLSHLEDVYVPTKMPSFKF
jgi:hypothetical protein